MTKTALYVRTFSATTRHIINPDAPEKTLCGSRCVLPELFIGDGGEARITDGWMVFGLPACQRCEKSAAKRGIVADTRERDVEIAAAEARALNMEKMPATITPEIAEDLTRRINEAADKLAAEGTPVESVRREAVASIERQTVATGDKVIRDGLKGKVLEVCTRAGVMLAAVAFGLAEFVWVRVAELVTL